jgi:DNA-binding winged helix-turn-helix (wHTH) protein
VPAIHFVDGQTFHPDSGEVRGDDRVCRLEPQPAALLALLAARAGTVVSHAEIAGHLWPDGTHVDFQAGIHYAVRQVRAALDDGRRGRLVETLPRRGYRLRADALLAADAVASAAPLESGQARRWRRRTVVAIAAAAAVATVAVEQRPNDHHARMVALLTTLHDLVY